MDRELLAYLAGILDADGYFTIKRSTYHIRVRGDARVPLFSEKIGCKQVQPEAIRLLRENFGGYYRIERPTAKKGKPLHAWSITDKQASKAATLLLPFLRVKRRQAELILALRLEKDKPHSESRIVVGRRPFKHWTGRIIQMKTKGMSPEAVAIRQHLFESIKALNDTRIWQPKLG